LLLQAKSKDREKLSHKPSSGTCFASQRQRCRHVAAKISWSAVGSHGQYRPADGLRDDTLSEGDSRVCRKINSAWLAEFAKAFIRRSSFPPPPRPHGINPPPCGLFYRLIFHNPIFAPFRPIASPP
jgi:hypothetical protein